MSVLVHDLTVAGPVAAPNLSMAKGLAAEEARRVLDDPLSPHHLSRVCVCGRNAVSAGEAAVEVPLDVVPEELDDETTDGFALLARILIEEIEDPELAGTQKSDEEERSGDDSDENAEDETVEELEVERLMGFEEV